MFAWIRRILGAGTDELGREALLIARERPEAWEFLLFAQVVQDEIRKNVAVEQDGSDDPLEERVSFPDIGRWAKEKTDALRNTAEEVTELITSDHPEAYGPAGEPGNVWAIMRLSKEVALYHKKALHWKKSVANAHVDPECEKLRDALARYADPLIRALEGFGPKLRRTVKEAVNAPPGSPKVIEMTFKLESPDSAAVFSEEIGRLTKVAKERFGENDSSGYIYILINPSLNDNFLKIGKTMRSPEKRADELSRSTGIPSSFIVAYEARVANPHRAEKLIHRRLRRYRVNQKREFFQLPLKHAVTVVNEVVDDMEM